MIFQSADHARPCPDLGRGTRRARADVLARAARATQPTTTRSILDLSDAP